MTVLYGLDNCDTTKKARKWLERFAVPHEFIDYRAQRPSPETLKQWAQAVGGWDKLVNRQSTTWRQLPESRKQPQFDPEWTLLLRASRAGEAPRPGDRRRHRDGGLHGQPVQATFRALRR